MASLFVEHLTVIDFSYFDTERLDRSYFPNINFNNLTQVDKQTIIDEIENDFKIALKGIEKLPVEARLGVYTAYKYYKKLLKKLKKTEAKKILDTRIRVSNPMKLFILSKSYIRYQLNYL